MPADLRSKGFSFIFDQLVFAFLYFSVPFIKEAKSLEYIRIGMLGIIFMHLFSGVEFVSRLALFYYIFVILAMPIAIMSMIKERDRALLIYAILILLFTQHIFRISLNPHEIVPYYTTFT